MTKKELQKMSADELLQALQNDINDLEITQNIDEDIAEAHMLIAEELHERAVQHEKLIRGLR
tara:strand:+ start:426 stop:611 length:186 start_codon:yes stop_codon:yes gene_type:complete